MVESVNVIKQEGCDQDEADGDHQLQDEEWDGGNPSWCEEGWPVSESLRQ